MALYPNYRPVGVRKAWDHTSIGLHDMENVMRRYGVPAEYGMPADAVVWFSPDTGALRLGVADYANGRRATLRITNTGSKLSLVTIAKATGAAE